MKLENKNLFYSLLLAAVLAVFLLGYFMLMLPSLYLEYMDERNLDAVAEQQRTYLRQKSYEGITPKNPSACFTIEVPTQGEDLLFTNAYVSARLHVQDAEAQALLQEIQKFFQGKDLLDDFGSADSILDEEQKQSMEAEMHRLLDSFRETEDFPISVEILSQKEQQADDQNGEFAFHQISDDLIVLETKYRDAQNQYSTYLAVTNSEDAIILSVLPSMTTRMGEIREVVGGSLPMLLVVIVLLVLLFSFFYSNGIMKPLFQKLKVTNEELDQKNRILQEENHRQEVFLRASSHQLKTPISAALLLVDGMISKTGKFADCEKYLPKVKEQLLSMRKMVEDILSLNHSREHMRRETVDAGAVLDAVLTAYEIKCHEKELELVRDGENSCELETDADMLRKMIDNLVSNAVCYAKPHSRIRIRLERNLLELENEGHIPEELKEHIFEPFVSGNTGRKAHGLGLYIVSFYAQLLDMSVTVQNVGDLVVSGIKFS
ncbi:MAG: HAMP domain-containing histidine kinase [Lachnospiraceae bacterium]|nr:HAMP domain-containing histidine kinase [Lachnospiraceae bacterium]